MDEQKKFLSNLSPKAAFLFGIGGALAVLFIVGFFILLSMVLSDDRVLTQKNDTTAGAQPSVAAPSGGGEVAADTNFIITKDDHIYGEFGAPITLVEFSDFECPFCSRFHPTVKRIVDEYPGKVRWVYKHFPLSSIHSNAQPAAEASECAAELGGNDAFWEFSDGLFANQETLGRDTYITIAGGIGLNTNDFIKCFDSGKYRSKVLADQQRGAAAGVRGTPGSFINGQEVPGAVPYEQVKAIVESLL